MPAPDPRKLDDLERAMQKKFERTTVFALTDDDVHRVLAGLHALHTGAVFNFAEEERYKAGRLAVRIARQFIRSCPPGERTA